MKKLSQHRPVIPILIHWLALGLLTFAFAFFSLRLIPRDTVLTPLWLPTSIMMVALYRYPGKQWPGVIFFCLLGNIGASLTQASTFAPVFTAISTFESIIGALLLRKLLPKASPLQNLYDWFRMIIGCTCVPPLVGSALIWLLTASPGTCLSWGIAEAIGALAFVPFGLLFKPDYLRYRHNPQLLLETLVMLMTTLLISSLSMLYLPWPFIFVLAPLVWSGMRLPRLESFMIFLVTVMTLAVLMVSRPLEFRLSPSWSQHDISWLPFLMVLLPANAMSIVMHVFRSDRKRIAESEERFRNAMEYSAIGMSLMSLEGQWLQVNKSLCRFLGYSRDELCGLNYRQVTVLDDLDCDREYRNQLISGEINSYSIEKRYYTRQGDIVWGLLAVSLVRYANGSPRYFITQVEDINELKHSEWMNKRLMERITLANEASGIGIWEWVPESGQLIWDKQMYKLYDVPPETCITRELWYGCIVEEDRLGVQQTFFDARDKRISLAVEFRIRIKEEIRYIRAQANCLQDEQSNTMRFLGINIDVTEVKQLHDALFQEKERLHITLDSIGEAVFCTDANMHVTFMNPNAEKISGWTQEQALNQPLLTVLPINFGNQKASLEDIHNGARALNDIEQDIVLHSRNGNSYDIRYSIAPLSTIDGQNIGSVLVIQDVSESRKMLRQLSYSASHDALTQLANRTSFDHHLTTLLQTVPGTPQRHALVFLDLDHFKSVNDTAGHAAGDALLRELSSLMLGLLRAGDILARMGGDEFALLLLDCNRENARTIAGRIVNAINDYPFIWNNTQHRIGASAGISLIDKDNCQAEEVMSQADTACYASKNSGRGIITVYEPASV